MWSTHHVEDRLVRSITQASKLRREADGDPQAKSAATVDLLSALESLRREVEPPAEVAHSLKLEPVKRFTLVMAMEMGLVDYLAAMDEGARVTARDLGEALGFEEGLIGEEFPLLTALWLG